MFESGDDFLYVPHVITNTNHTLRWAADAPTRSGSNVPTFWYSTWIFRVGHEHVDGPPGPDYPPDN